MNKLMILKLDNMVIHTIFGTSSSHTKQIIALWWLNSNSNKIINFVRFFLQILYKITKTRMSTEEVVNQSNLTFKTQTLEELVTQQPIPTLAPTSIDPVRCMAELLHSAMASNQPSSMTTHRWTVSWPTTAIAQSWLRTPIQTIRTF